MLDLQLEGVREAPLSVVVRCDRRASAAGVLGRATVPDADLRSCAVAIDLWLAARAAAQLAAGVKILRWLRLGWPDERPPAPGPAAAGLFAVGIHTVHLARGDDAYQTPVSISLLAATGALSTAQLQLLVLDRRCRHGAARQTGAR